MRAIREGFDTATYGLARVAERLLPPGVLHAILWPGAAALSAAALVGRRTAHSPWRSSFRLRWLNRTHLLLARTMTFWPDRFQTARWQERLSIQGTEHLEGDRPVLLVTLHYGPLGLLGRVLRARGHAATHLSDYIGRWRSRVSLRVDGLAEKSSGTETVPYRLNADMIWEARDHLRNHGPLIIAVDGRVGGCAPVTSGRDTVLLNTRGTMRLAEISQADVVPCVVRADAGLRLTLDIGEPLPRELVDSRKRHADGYSVLLGRLLELAGRAPGQCRTSLNRCFLPAQDTL